MTAKTWTVAELGESLGCKVIGAGDTRITAMAPIEESGPADLTFLANPRYRRFLDSCRAGAIIVAPSEVTPGTLTRLETSNPYQVFRLALELIYPAAPAPVQPGIHPLAIVDDSASIGEGVRIAPFVEVAPNAKIGARTVIFCNAYVGHSSVIGKDCSIGVGAVVRHRVTLGNRVVIGDGTVIGFDGFGYAPEADGFHKIPQVGEVILEDDVEIGANCCIDRATVGATRIGKGSKLDNLIQVAHGVHIGSDNVIAAQTGISGSTTIGSRVMIGGQAGTVGHIEIGDRMIIGAQAGVTKSVDINGLVSGYPARPHMEAMRIDAALSQLPELIKRVRALEKRLQELEESA